MEAKKKITDKIKKYLKIGVVVGMATIGAMPNAQASNNNIQPEEKNKITVSENMVNMEEKKTSFEINKPEEETFKEKVDNLAEKRKYLKDQIKKFEKEEFNKRLKVQNSALNKKILTKREMKNKELER